MKNDDLSDALDRLNPTAEERERILGKVLEQNKMARKKPLSKKKIKWIPAACAAAGAAAVVLAAAWGMGAARNTQTAEVAERTVGESAELYEGQKAGTSQATGDGDVIYFGGEAGDADETSAYDGARTLYGGEAGDTDETSAYDGARTLYGGEAGDADAASAYSGEAASAEVDSDSETVKAGSAEADDGKNPEEPRASDAEAPAEDAEEEKAIGAEAAQKNGKTSGEETSAADSPSEAKETAAGPSKASTYLPVAALIAAWAVAIFIFFAKVGSK